MKIYLIRHAESEGNLNPRIYTQKFDEDIDLSERGIKQSLDLSETLFFLFRKTLPLTFVSTFLRARRTAEISLSKFRYVKFIENPLLVERGWGDLRYKVLNKSHNDDDFRFFNRPANGESFFDLYQRVFLFISYLKQDYIHYREVLIFTHGEWIKMFDMIVKNKPISIFKEESKNIKINNCQLSDYSLF